mmetsp:Transcript_18326/g.44118  ORF Transcript_18326/g.44118 Transcript_18326/m.44118 type:complete len:200 (-) Transcript_18326:342-941(-)
MYCTVSVEVPSKRNSHSRCSGTSTSGDLSAADSRLRQAEISGLWRISNSLSSCTSILLPSMTALRCFRAATTLSSRVILPRASIDDRSEVLSMLREISDAALPMAESTVSFLRPRASSLSTGPAACSLSVVRSSFSIAGSRVVSSPLRRSLRQSKNTSCCSRMVSSDPWMRLSSCLAACSSWSKVSSIGTSRPPFSSSR